MRCPRCQRASPDEAVFCPGCGAPLTFRAEPTPRPLDLSISLDRRAGARELSLDPLHEAAHVPPWDLRGRLGLAPAPSPSAALQDDEDGEIAFGPVPELAPDLEPGPGPALAQIAATVREPSREPGPAEDPDRPLARALGLAPDPVMPDDLGLPGGAAGDRHEPGLVLGGAPAPTVLERELDLALDVPGRPEDGRDVDVSLPLPLPMQPDQLPLPLREVGPHLRGARPGRRAAAWAVDAAPLVLLWVGGLAALYDGVPLSPGDHAGLLERMLRDGGALALPLVGVIATLALVHQTLAHALAGATLGKWLLGLRVVSEEGERPSVGRCAARAALSAASVLLLGAGLLPALFTRSGRALHDISAGTRVVESP